MVYLLISLIWAQIVDEAPRAKELCLQDTVALKQLMEAHECKWESWDKNSKKMNPCPRDLNLSCGAIDDVGPQYRLCLENIRNPQVGPLSKEDIESIYATETAICKDDDTHRPRCSYAPGRTDGAPEGNTSEEYCRVRTKKLIPAGAQQ